ncbi:uncharacterized protein LOC107835442 isoform X2 [Poecilia formosa]|uniref:uncharacterized protein LOC107835442 isoform X2 n=1 Tax=Poecilia formosa TaxID=48698 RepID=UPI0007BA4D49|nr:PREDICTED: uncharacterized protein LOC107835442 isoform X2 [Poecilia formosa]
MGNANSCNSSLVEGPDGDEKYMLSRFPGSIVHMKKWKKKYKIDGKLKIDQWQTIVGILDSSVARKKGIKKAKKEDELRCAKLWLKAAIDRKEQIKKAVEGITPVTEDPDKWIEDMTGLIQSYRLNGVEAGEAAMSSLGKDWVKVRGNYTGKAIDNNNILAPIPYPPGANPALSDDFKAQWDPLCERVRTNFRKKANYSHLSEIKQKVGEDVDDFRLRFEKEFKVHSGITYDEGLESVYQQQLKNALMSSFRPEIEGWIKKHLVEYDAASVPQLMTWARHAEKVVKKPKTGSDVFHLEDFGEVDTSVFFCGSSRGRGRNRDRGGRPGQRPLSYKPQDKDVCWRCGGSNHWAKDCKAKNIKDYRSGRWEKKQKSNSSA